MKNEKNAEQLKAEEEFMSRIDEIKEVLNEYSLKKTRNKRGKFKFYFMNDGFNDCGVIGGYGYDCPLQGMGSPIKADTTVESIRSTIDRFFCKPGEEQISSSFFEIEYVAKKETKTKSLDCPKLTQKDLRQTTIFEQIEIMEKIGKNKNLQLF